MQSRSLNLRREKIARLPARRVVPFGSRLRPRPFSFLRLPYVPSLLLSLPLSFFRHPRSLSSSIRIISPRFREGRPPPRICRPSIGKTADRFGV